VCQPPCHRLGISHAAENARRGRQPSQGTQGRSQCTYSSSSYNAPIVTTKNKAQTYGKALVVLASLLCLSVCGNLATSALTILVVKESRTRGAIQPVVLSDSKAAAPVGTGLTPYGTVASRPPPPPPRQRDSLSAERLRLDSAVATPPPPSDDSLSSSKASNAPPATPVAPSQAGGLLSATHVQAWLALYTFVDSGKCLFVGIWPVCLTSKESRPLSQMVGMKSVIFPRQCL